MILPMRTRTELGQLHYFGAITLHADLLQVIEKKLESLAPRARFELATLRLTAECSTIELPGNRCNTISFIVIQTFK